MARASVRRILMTTAIVGVGAALAACNKHASSVHGGGMSLNAQYAALGSAPPNARPGACYKKVVHPAVTREVSDQVRISSGGTLTTVVQPQYVSVTEQILVQEETQKLVDVPPTYKVEQRQVELSPEVERVKVIPAQFRTVRETVWVAPDGTHHDEAPRVRSYKSHRVQTRGPREVRKHQSQVRSTDRVIRYEGEWRIVVEPAKYGTRSTPVYGVPAGWRRTTITRRELIKPEETRTYVEPAEYKTVRERVVDTPASTQVVTVPPKYETITKRVPVGDAKKVVVPAQPKYETVTRVETVAPAQVVWAEVLCDTSINEDVVRALQHKMFDLGYYNGAIDGTYNVNLDQAVSDYQTDNNLASGGLTLETLRSLGISA